MSFEDTLVVQQAVIDCPVPAAPLIPAPLKSATIDIPKKRASQGQQDQGLLNQFNSYTSERSSISSSGFLGPLLLKCQSMPTRTSVQGLHVSTGGQQQTGVGSAGGNAHFFGHSSSFERGFPLGAQKLFEGKQ
uniref:Uncharacterized protein n=1 Tax=Dunaliella tertiolecta TaxID=3047 RepID=A0A7S3QQK2_DUNTE|mmetsp:Transcript_5923/g.15751  ORF Transcript_5923/g.15751 Transcript_5923/m.15751 type:complete len:133 (-) Transcript_5923:797-1195(-)|eukprot:CAMPEP_0202351688 /NCGR_PEP_ID=MMETSP1126-20121109/8217_1 /ASSEMBLY_ACC=CAM_ASM_000457 /TAXON_ID=3047 /ORGANISM="Dunaliella tertiolecta, Strain CCMP1320" /LENGTH=132 /DNA_ID=CAMNT_0048943823 /DNA_START=180 /DNA_END=578 /DNA_ORIENTATION=-